MHAAGNGCGPGGGVPPMLRPAARRRSRPQALPAGWGSATLRPQAVFGKALVSCLTSAWQWCIRCGLPQLGCGGDGQQMVAGFKKCTANRSVLGTYKYLGDRWCFARGYPSAASSGPAPAARPPCQSGRPAQLPPEPPRSAPAWCRCRCTHQWPVRRHPPPPARPWGHPQRGTGP